MRTKFEKGKRGFKKDSSGFLTQSPVYGGRGMIYTTPDSNGNFYFRTWIAEATDAPYEVAEEVLAHSVDNKVARAYKRTDYIEMRRTIIDYWAEFVTGTKHTQIIRIR